MTTSRVDTVLQESMYVLTQEKCPVFGWGKCIMRMTEVKDPVFNAGLNTYAS